MAHPLLRPALPLLLAFGLACNPLPPELRLGPGELSPADQAALEARIDAFLAFATAGGVSTSNPLAAIALLEAAERGIVPEPAPGTFGPSACDADVARIAPMADTTPFVLRYMLNAWLGYHPHPALDPVLWQKTKEAFLSFKFWYSDPQPEGITDDKWYWSENHQIIF